MKVRVGEALEQWRLQLEDQRQQSKEAVRQWGLQLQAERRKLQEALEQARIQLARGAPGGRGWGGLQGGRARVYRMVHGATRRERARRGGRGRRREEEGGEEEDRYGQGVAGGQGGGVPLGSRSDSEEEGKRGARGGRGGWGGGGEVWAGDERGAGRGCTRGFVERPGRKRVKRGARGRVGRGGQVWAGDRKGAFWVGASVFSKRQ